MNAVPISTNAVSGGNAADDAGVQSAKTPGLPSFAQVLADKQRTPGPTQPKPQPVHEAPAKNTASRNTAAKENADAQPATQAHQPQRQVENSASMKDSTTTASAKKTDTSSKVADDSSSCNTAAANATTPPAAVVNALPVLPADLPNAEPAAVLASGEPAAEPALAPQEAANATIATVLASSPLQASVNAGLADAAAVLQNLPLTANAQSSNAADSVAAPVAAANQDASTVPAIASKPTIAPNDLAAIAQPDPQTDPNAAPAAPAAPASAAPVASSGNNSSGPSANFAVSNVAKSAPQSAKPAPLADQRQSAQEIPQAMNLPPAKPAEAEKRPDAEPASNSANVSSAKQPANDAAAQNPATAATISQALGAQNDSQQDWKLPNSTSVPTQAPAKALSIKSTANAKPDTSQDSSFDSNENSGSAVPQKGAGFNLDPAAPHAPAQPNPNDPGSAAANVAVGIGAVAAGAKESVTSPKSNADSSPNSVAASLEAEYAHPQSMASKIVNVAQLSGNAVHSEVRIAMQAEQLGQVELHATVNGQQVGANITVEKKEAHAALAVELPSLQQALEDRHLRVSEVVLTQSTLHSTSGDAGNAGHTAGEQQRRNQAGFQYQQSESNTSFGNVPGAIVESSGIFDNRGRLSVRA